MVVDLRDDDQFIGLLARDEVDKAGAHRFRRANDHQREHRPIGLDGLIVHSPINQDSKAVLTWSVNHRRVYVDFAWAMGRTKDGQKIIWRKYFDEQVIGEARSAVARLSGSASAGLGSRWRRLPAYRVITADE